MSALLDSLIKPINLYAEELSNANGSNLPKQSGIVCALWRVPKLDAAGLAAQARLWEIALRESAVKGCPALMDKLLHMMIFIHGGVINYLQFCSRKMRSPTE